jgi:hypothetical protein
VTNTGTIETFGANAHAIVAQSIGGGGGNAGVGIGLTSNVETTLIANGLSMLVGGFLGGDGGLGGAVTVTHTGNIIVHGNGAKGIKAESINGGGGDLVLDFAGISGGLPLGGQPGASDPVLVLVSGADQTTNSAAGAEHHRFGARGLATTRRPAACRPSVAVAAIRR